MNNPKKPQVELKYNGKDCTKDFSRYLNSVTFQEFEDEQSDELTINLNNSDGYFTDLWYPNKGDKLTCNIIFGKDDFSCGSFIIDDNDFDFSTSGDFVEIKALATSTNNPVRSNKTINHSGKTLNQIAFQFGKEYGFKVLGGEDTKVGTVIQKNETDLSFLKRISREYGYIFNIKDNLLTFIKVDELINQESIFKISRSDISSLRLTDTTAKMYGKVKVSYFDNKTKNLKTYTAQGNSQLSDTYTVYKKCTNLEEAKQVATSALKLSHKEVKGTIQLNKPISNFMAGVNFNIYGVGKFEGKYHIKTAKRVVNSSGYTIEGEIYKI